MIKKKIAIVVGNLGGPSNLEEVEQFLYNLFLDKSITGLPYIFRKKLAKKISLKRKEFSKNLYRQIGSASPILSNTIEQSEVLEKQLDILLDTKQKTDISISTFVSMRYSKPFASDCIKQLEKDNFSQIILLPLYPQYSTTTTKSFIDEYKLLLKKSEKLSKIPCKTIKSFFLIDGFSDYYYSKITEILDKKENKLNLNKVIILYSAHSLPKMLTYIRFDPYVKHLKKSIKLINNKLEAKYDKINYELCYQSAPFRFNWLNPFLEDLVVEYSKDNYNLIVVPLSFISEHLETLYELDIEYKKLSQKYGAMSYHRIATPFVDDNFINSLANKIYDNILEC